MNNQISEYYVYDESAILYIHRFYKKDGQFIITCGEVGLFYELLYALDNHLIECDIRYIGRNEKSTIPLIEVSNITLYGKLLAETL